MSLDLSAIQDFAEAELMADTDVIVTRDTPGTADDLWDAETMTYTQPADDADTVYDGKCWISSVSVPADETVAGQENILTWYVLNIPLDSPEIKYCDVVTCTRNVRDEELVDQNFLVLEVLHGTFKVKKAIRMQKITLVPKP